MKERVISLMAATAMLLASQIANGQTCPSPAPSCSSSGTLTDFSGTYSCTLVTTNSTGGVEVQLLTFNADGAGNISGGMGASNNNSSSGTTFSAFTALNNATYCLNTDDTGYIFKAAGSGGCPLALAIDDSLSEVRLIDTTENTAGAMTCRAQ